MVLQVPIRRVPVISTVWSATITALTPTKWWPTDGSIRSWTASWLQASRSSPRPSTAPSTAAVTRGSRPITTAGNASTPCWGSPRWRPTSTDTWMSRAGPGERERGDRQVCPSQAASEASSAGRPRHECSDWASQQARLTWETGVLTVTTLKQQIQFKLHFLTYYLYSDSCPKFNVKPDPFYILWKSLFSLVSLKLSIWSSALPNLSVIHAYMHHQNIFSWIFQENFARCFSDNQYVPEWASFELEPFVATYLICTDIVSRCLKGL